MDQEVPFNSKLAALNLEGLQRQPSVWSRNLFDDTTGVKTDASRTVFDIVKDKGLNMLIFQVNIAFYHWFFVSVDFDKGEMVVHD